MDSETEDMLDKISEAFIFVFALFTAWIWFLPYWAYKKTKRRK